MGIGRRIGGEEIKRTNRIGGVTGGEGGEGVAHPSN